MKYKKLGIFDNSLTNGKKNKPFSIFFDKLMKNRKIGDTCAFVKNMFTAMLGKKRYLVFQFNQS